jgi:hypothetical protein
MKRNTRRLLACLSALSTVVTFTLVSAGPAAAETIGKQDYATGRCLDDSYAYGLRSFPCNGLIYQEFNLTQAREPYDATIFVNAATQRCMDDSYAFGLRSIPCNGSLYQEFVSVLYGALRNVETGRCVDDSFGAGLRAIPCNQSFYQDWVSQF